MKKVFGLLLAGIVWVFSFGAVVPVHAQPLDLLNPIRDWAASAWNTEGVEVIGWWVNSEDGLVNTIKSFINWILSILAFIALIVLLWGGFQMVTAAGDENRYKKWFEILKQAALWLVMIGLAALIVWLIFFVINRTGNTWEVAAGTA